MNHSGDANKMVGEDHIRDATKMVSEDVSNEQMTAQATPNEELRRQILSHVVPKNEREWWAASAIERLERELNAANQRIQRLEEERDALKADIAIAAGELRIPIPEPGTDMARMMSANAILRHRNTDLLTRMKRLEEAGDSLKAAGYFGGFGDAVNKWNKAKEDKP